MPPRILVLSASVGAGHLRAAEAVFAALGETAPDIHAENLDVLKLTNAAFRRLYAKSYLDLVNKAPHLLGYFYDKLDRPPKRGKYGSDWLRLLLQKFNLRKLIRKFEKEPWDLVINTHFLPAELLASLRRDGRSRIPQVTVITDFEAHRMWVNQPTERYFAATEEARQSLQYWGIPLTDISVTGIPVHPIFSVAKNPQELRARHGLDPQLPIILQMAGGFGVGPIEQIYRALLSSPVAAQLVVIAGRNEAVKKELEAITVPAHHRARIVGFTTEIDEFMKMADLIVSKPGGLTTSETLASGAVMIVMNPIPGQETRNSDILLENGAAVKANSVGTLAYKVTTLLQNPERLAQLRAGAKRLGRPQAAHEIVRQSLELLSKLSMSLRASSP